MTLKEYREKKKLTQKALGLLLKVTEQAVSHYETGKRMPEKHTMLLIEKVTGNWVKAQDFY